ncbi:GNAT family N-acetyltransferase [Frankia sp. Cas3]|uniref:bifunctional acetate--CoA ligase family protein/GNAT family N-acetyltransferase n=1 Tax=Frankia sp. Cas3 TaxID=3073926 RepID=UPI002AD2FC80|nr:GNAT family N-acetyltransferase [Frankia sp. Cas3]
MWSECDAVLRDGGIVHLRPVTGDDEAALRALHEGLSPRAAYLRFFTAGRAAAAWYVDHLVRAPAPDHAALAALVGGRIVGVAGYERLDDPTGAEVAFAVEDAQQGCGLGTLLLEHLASYAREHGVRRFVAETLADNDMMMAVFTDAGFPVKRHHDGGTVDVSFPLVAGESLLTAQDHREGTADVRSLTALLRPASVVVVGASRRPRTVGHEVVRNLLASGFAGCLAVVNPHAGDADEIAGVRTYQSILDVPAPVDLAVLAVPAPAVTTAVEQCARLGVKGLVVLSAGFAEVGVQGAARERELLAAARRLGMRLVGPNCMGIANLAADVRLNATFAPNIPGGRGAPQPPGRVGFLSQSGGLGIALLEQASTLGLGVSTFVSVGNKADVSGNDLLMWWEQDPDTDVIALYLESFGNPRKFSRIARRVSRHTPIVAVKGGASAAGARAASSHTAAAASPAVQVSALFRQAGVIAVDGLGELFDVVTLLAHHRVGVGRRLAIVGNAGGPLILAADATAAAGLDLPELAEPTRRALADLLPAGAAVANPVDTIASVSGAAFEQALRIVLADDGIDAVLAVIAPTPLTGRDDLTAAVVAAAGSSTPLTAVVLGQAARVRTLTAPDSADSADSPDKAPSAAVPSFAVPEDAVRALSLAAAHTDWLRRPRGTVPIFDDIVPETARGIVDATLAARSAGGWLQSAAAAQLLAAYGIPVARSEHAASAQEAAAVAEHIDGPVVLKAANPDLVHKTDLGGVRLDLATPADVADAFRSMQAQLGEAMGGAVVQAMVAPGVETLVGIVQDPAFGPLVGFGLGGVLTDLLADRAFRLVPLTDRDAAELVRAVRGSTLLFGFRGSPPCDVAAVEDILLRVARLADDLPEVVEMDMNPLIVHERGAVAVDVKIRLAPVPEIPDPTLRRLR